MLGRSIEVFNDHYILQTMKISCRTALVLLALLVFVPCYAQAGDKTLRIDPRHIAGVQDMRTEITSMLEDLGYKWQPIRDPSNGQPMQVIEKYGQYRMLFRTVDNDSIQVEVHVRKSDNMTGLHFSEVGAKRPGDTALDYFQKIKDRAVLEFGADNVSDRHSFTTP